MSRTSTALKRLGVPGLAAITLVAGLPLFMGTATAAPVTSLTLTPVDGNDSGAAGSCQAYYVDGTSSSPSTTSTVGETVNVILRDLGTNATANADFCTAPTGPATPSAGTTISTGGPQTGGGSVDQREFVLTQNGAGNNVGRAIIGVTRNEPGNVRIQAYSDTNDNNEFNAGEPQVQRDTVFTAGGPAGSNANQDAADDVEVIDNSTPATATVTAGPTTDTAIEGETRTYRVAVLNNLDDRLAGVTVNFVIDSDGDPSADRGSTVFGVTDNNGIATGTITFPERASAPDVDSVTFFVNQTGLNSTNGIDNALPNEPRDTIAVTVSDNAPQQNRTVTLTPLADTDNANNQNNPAVNSVRDTNRSFRAVTDAPDGTTFTTTQLAFTVTGGSGDETVTPRECNTADYTPGAGDPSSTDANNGFCDVVVNDPTPVAGEVLTITVNVRGTAATATSTLTFRNAPADARFITLAPKTSNPAPNSAQQLTATVTDVDGKPVQGVTVTFTETGAGAFRNGNSTSFGTTNAAGQATAEVISLPGETGTMTVTATIDNPQRSGANGTASFEAPQCRQLANQGTDPQGNALNSTNNTGAAGDCDDTATVNFGGTASPSATPSGTATPAPTGSPSCAVVPTVTLEFGTINATGSSGVTVTAPANSQIQLLAYSQPSTTYRVVRNATIDNTGTPAQFRITPPTNTRLYAQIVGCTTNPTTASKVLNVRTTLSLNVTRTGTRAYRFFGDSLPARPGGLIVSLYRVTDSGSQILTAQTRASASTGDWVINRVFTGTGRFGFVVRTGQDLQNAPGASNVRSLLIF